MSDVRLTKAQERGLRLVGSQLRARVSNVTDEARGFVYWQVAENLTAKGLTRMTGVGDRVLRMTTDGWGWLQRHPVAS